MKRGRKSRLVVLVSKSLDPDGDSVGTFVTNGDGRIEIPLSKSGNYTDN